MAPESAAPRPLVTAVAAMLAQQSLVTMSALTIPVLLPPIAVDLGINPGLLGFYTALLYGTAMIASTVGGGFILRYGAIRVSQAAMGLMGLGLIVAYPGSLGLFALAAVLCGTGQGPSTPASSHVLSRHSPPSVAPLIFSIKQTGVPIGGALAGAILPFLAVRLGWQGALLAAGGMCLLLAVGLQAVRESFDSDRHRGRRLTSTDIRTTVGAVLGSPPLRELAVASFVFAGLQVAFGSFFVAYLAEGLSFSYEVAGFVFAAAQGTAIGGRILWGWIAGRWIESRLLLGLLGLVMALAAILTGSFTPDWPVWALTAVAVVFGATAIGWNGVFLAEIVRHSPEGQAGVVTGGVLSFTFAGLVLFPSGFGAILGLSGSYALGFFVAAVPTAIVGLMFLRATDSRS